MITQIQDPAAVHYAGHVKLIHHITKSFVKTRGGDYDHYVSYAMEAFMKAARTWDPERGPLHKRIAYFVYHALLSECRRLAKSGQYSVKNFTDMGDKDFYIIPLREQRENYLAGLEGDARTIAEVVVNYAPTVYEGPEGIREMVIELCLELGWTTQRISETFKQGRQALAS